MNDEKFSIVEEQLRNDAPLLLVSENRRQDLWAAYIVRRRRRAVRASLATMAALVLAVAGLAAWRQHVGVRPAAPLRPAAVADAKERKSPVDRTAAARRIVTAGRASVSETVLVVPFVIDDPASGQHVISGFYVPEHVEPLDSLDLSPAERDAVRSVLGLEGEDRLIIQPI